MAQDGTGWHRLLSGPAACALAHAGSSMTRAKLCVFFSRCGNRSQKLVSQLWNRHLLHNSHYWRVLGVHTRPQKQKPLLRLYGNGALAFPP